jgi:hypothetical protein
MGQFTEALKDAPESSGATFKLVTGENKIRVLTEPKYIETMFKGNMSRKWLTYIIDRKDGQLKLFFMPKTIVKAIADYEDNEFYKFDKLPMPYDIIIKAQNAGTIEAEYLVIASPKREDLTPAEAEMLKNAKPIDEVISKILESQQPPSETAISQAA